MIARRIDWSECETVADRQRYFTASLGVALQKFRRKRFLQNSTLHSMCSNTPDYSSLKGTPIEINVQMLRIRRL